MFSFSCLVIISYLEAHSKLSHGFSLVYGAEEVIPVEVMVPSNRRDLARKLSFPHDRIYDVEAFEESRHNAESKWLFDQKQISEACNKKVGPRTPSVGDLVLKIT